MISKISQQINVPFECQSWQSWEVLVYPILCLWLFMLDPEERRDPLFCLWSKDVTEKIMCFRCRRQCLDNKCLWGSEHNTLLKDSPLLNPPYCKQDSHLLFSILFDLQKHVFPSISLHPGPCLPIEFSVPRPERLSKTYFPSCPWPAYSLSVTSHKLFTKPSIYLAHKALCGKIIACYPLSGLTSLRTPLPKHRLVDIWLPALLICL